MSNAWEMTVEDVENALDSNKNIISEKFMQSHGLTPDDLEGAAEHAHNAILHRADEVEDAALCGDDMDEQTAYAHNAIVSILVEEGILIPAKEN